MMTVLVVPLTGTELVVRGLVVVVVLLGYNHELEEDMTGLEVVAGAVPEEVVLWQPPMQEVMVTVDVELVVMVTTEPEEVMVVVRGQTWRMIS